MSQLIRWAGNASIIKWILDSAALSVSLSFAERPGLILRVICFLRVSFSVLAGRKWKVLPLLEGDGGRLARLYYSSYPLHDLLRPDTTLLRKNMIFNHFYISLFNSTKCWCKTFLAVHQLIEVWFEVHFLLNVVKLDTNAKYWLVLIGIVNQPAGDIFAQNWSFFLKHQ